EPAAAGLRRGPIYLVDPDDRALVAGGRTHEAGDLVIGVAEPEVAPGLAIERVELAAAGRGLHAQVPGQLERAAAADQPQRARDPAAVLVVDLGGERGDRLAVRRRHEALEV